MRDAGHDVTAPMSDAKADVAKDVGADTGPGNEAPGLPCTVGAQCSSLVCALPGDAGAGDAGDAGACAGGGCQCQPPTCTDGVKNQNETGVDCGGNCQGCGVGITCVTGKDCASGECGIGFKGGNCTATTPDGGAEGGASGAACACETPTCGDGVKNQDETDIDCGGKTCPHCGTGKTCGAASDCTSDVCSAGSAGSRCACPAGMTEASTSVQAAYCIDTYEITYAQYLVFTNQAIPTSSQPAECAWNTTFIPSQNWPQSGGSLNNPVTNVDWCDAFAYCQASGKHLCGEIGNPATSAVEGDAVPFGASPDGGTMPANDPTVDEWYNACSGQGQDTYPYGVNYDPVRCNGVDSPPQSTSGPVEAPPGVAGSTIVSTQTCIFNTTCNSTLYNLPTVAANQSISCPVLPPMPAMGATPSCGSVYTQGECIGGISPQLFDMSGNVAEWENSCSGTSGASDNCLVRGGSFDSSPGSTTLACKASAAQPPVARNTSAKDIGFRCCL